MNRFIRSLHELLLNGEDMVIATIVDSSGSTPRSSGAKMAVRRPGLPGERILGTVGGGITEAMAIRDADTLFGGAPDAAILRELNLNRDLAAGTDMICGGKFTLLLEYVTPCSPGATAVGDLDIALRNGRPSLLLVRLAGANRINTSDNNEKVTCRIADQTVVPLDPHAEAYATDCFPGLTQDQLHELQLAAKEKGSAGLYDFNTDRILAEPVFTPTPVFLYGAGHVARCTAQLTTMMGFRTVVLDDRADFANVMRFPDADQLVVLDSFEHALPCSDEDSSASLGTDAFIVILTRGHVHDKTVLAQALRTPARYIGMIGSRKKRDDVYAALRSEGFSEEDISRCHCPIGLSIGAQTPEEIALSIVAELVAVRASHITPPSSITTLHPKSTSKSLAENP